MYSEKGYQNKPSKVNHCSIIRQVKVLDCKVSFLPGMRMLLGIGEETRGLLKRCSEALLNLQQPMRAYGLLAIGESFESSSGLVSLTQIN